MQTFPLILIVSTLAASALGVMGIAWCRCDRLPSLARWGRRLFLGVLGLLGSAGGLIALQPHRGVLVLGLAVGLLVIAMLWEGRPATAIRW